MPRVSGVATPSYRRHKSTGQAVATINGRDFYLGAYGTKASKAAYDALIQEWLANGRQAPANKQALSIVEVLDAYCRFAKGYYGGSGEYQNMLYALKPLRELYGRLNAAEFSPLKLKAVRQKMIDAGLCRNEVNQRTGRVRRFFAWAVENELIPPDVLHGLKAVRGLARGRSEAHESEAVKPVPEAFVDAIKAKVTPHIWAMVELQRYSGMRPGEVTAMRGCDIDTSGKVWVYSPPQHKNAWRGHERKIFLGPRAQAVLKPWLRLDTQAHLFQPREAEAWRREQLRQRRKTPLSCGNRAGTNRRAKPEHTPGNRYGVRAYALAIRRGCERAKVPLWSPNQLRHNAATWLRKEFGLDGARVVLGHRSGNTTEIYAALDSDKAGEIMAAVG